MLLKDINPSNLGSLPHTPVEVNGIAYFSAWDLVHGRELWRSDGTPQGTFMVVDVAPGNSALDPLRPNWSDPQALTRVGNTLYFKATDPSFGLSLFMSDGTAAGTTRLASFTQPLFGEENVTNLTAVGNELFFVAYDAATGKELWVTDGTPEGTKRVVDLRPGAEGSNPAGLTALGGKLYFAADDGVHGREIWETFGLTHQNFLSQDIREGPLGSNPHNLLVWDGKLFFRADDGTSQTTLVDISGPELWSTNITLTIPGEFAKSREQSNYIGPDANGVLGIGTPTLLTPGSPFALYFRAIGEAVLGSLGAEVWATTGTGENWNGCDPVHFGGVGWVTDTSEFGAPQQMAYGGINLFYTTKDSQNNWKLWATGGTPQRCTPGVVTPPVRNAELLLDLNELDVTWDPLSDLTPAGQHLFFVITTPENAQLWRSSGTPAGTILLKTFNRQGGEIESLANIGGKLFFTAWDDVHGSELWTSDGTPEGTVMAADLNPYSDRYINSSRAHDFTNIGDTLYFTAQENDSLPFQVWKSNGTPDGTQQVTALPPHPNFTGTMGELTAVGNTLYFWHHSETLGRELWKSDGTAEGTTIVRDIAPGQAESVPRLLTAVGSRLFFAARDAAQGDELWTTDGSEAGTVLVKDLVPGSGDSALASMVEFNDALYFTGLPTLSHGVTRGLWKSDGTEANTVQVKDILVRGGFFKLGETLYFAASEAEAEDFELWKSDGTTDGTVRVADLLAGPVGSGPFMFTNVNGTLYFTTGFGSGLSHGTDIWKTDGTPNGTQRVSTWDPVSMCAVGGTLFFSADGGFGVGEELFKSDGTPQGTVLVKNIAPGLAHSAPRGMIAANGKLYFDAWTPERGREVWESDGMPDGTVMIDDLAPGIESSIDFSAEFRVVNGSLYFPAYRPDVGEELWVIPRPPFSWRNLAQPLDVNADSSISPIDALTVINELNLNGSGPLPALSGPPPAYLDVNGDGFVSPIDALLVINHMNNVAAASAEGEATAAAEDSPDPRALELIFALSLWDEDSHTQTLRRRDRQPIPGNSRGSTRTPA